ncbi:Helix-turn-helix domain-containing protein [Mucilaginibacter pineti]|uniref:Helix-turn-helix domain-containing protein n=1 Tax=Mucilaginibacter pineti TaxID=1391627 RepID=A0A1G7I4D8_9SPHI|nr:helix-turn-helix transcriptional regulator [Mucilaginibacter pineti]SDF07326.1 Helix-turn-helix domain-containing protein [Mucilaginibacter pineti]
MHQNLQNYKVENVAVNIRHAREALFYTQEYLAAKLKISQNSYSKIELGYVKLSLDRFLKICQILDLEPSNLLKGETADAA